MRDRLAGRTVATVLSGAKIDADTLRGVATGALSVRDLLTGSRHVPCERWR